MGEGIVAISRNISRKVVSSTGTDLRTGKKFPKEKTVHWQGYCLIDAKLGECLW